MKYNLLFLLFVLTSSMVNAMLDDYTNILFSSGSTTTGGGSTTTLPASNISSGTFGSLVGGGDYVFPGWVDITSHLDMTGGSIYNLLGVISSSSVTFSSGINTNNVGTLDGYEASSLLDNTDSQTLSYTTSTDVISISGGNSIDITEVDTNAATICSGTSTYLDGEGNCDTLSVSGITEAQFKGETARNFAKNACFYDGHTGVANALQGWDFTSTTFGSVRNATVQTGFYMNVTADVSLTGWHQTTNPYVWIRVNTTDWSRISTGNDISGRQIRLSGNENLDNTDLVYDINNVNSTHIKIVMPYGMTIPGFTVAPAWGEPITTNELIEVVDVASRCHKAMMMLGTKTMYSEYLTVPNGVPFLIDAEVNTPKWSIVSGQTYARIIIQVEAYDLDGNSIYRFTTVGGPDYKSGIVSNSIYAGTNYNYYSPIGTEGWKRLQFQLPDMSDTRNWVAASNGLGSYNPAKKSPAIKVKIRLLNQYQNSETYFTGIQLIQGTTAKAFNLAELNEDTEGYSTTSTIYVCKDATCTTSYTCSLKNGLITGCS